MSDVVDLFAGPGGWSVALARLGLSEYGVEWDEDACRTARAAGHQRHHGDVRYFEAQPCTGLIASPPCQTFSRMGDGSGRDAMADLAAALDLVVEGVPPVEALTRVAGTVVDEAPLGFTWDAPVTHDERSALVLEPLRVALATRPEWIALEQVPDVLPIWERYAAVLRPDYSVAVGVLAAEAYGVPQTRRRAVLVASRVRDVELPRPTHSRYHSRTPDRLDVGVLPWVSMATALGWDDDDRRWARRFHDQSGAPFDPRWPILRPATTILGRGLVPNPGVNRNRHNGASKSRNDGIVVTVAEAGVLQTFPPDYPWAGSESAQHQQVGDAVPPLLAEAILRAVVEDLICTECGNDTVAEGYAYCSECLETVPL